MNGIEHLMETVKKLRDPNGGCPWDLEQTHQSIRAYLIEEAHEFLESLDTLGPDHPSTIEELGDILFQVALHAQMYSERSVSDLNDVAARVSDKFRRRHPHVFARSATENQQQLSPDAIRIEWEKSKNRERNDALPKTASLRSIPKAISGLSRSARLGDKAAASGFDWESAHQVQAKVEEELRELLEAIRSSSTGPASAKIPASAEIAEEFGDLLFAVSQWARKWGIDPEAAIQATNRKFISRFEAIEQALLDSNTPWDSLSPTQLEEVYQRVKIRLKQGMKQ